MSSSTHTLMCVTYNGGHRLRLPRRPWSSSEVCIRLRVDSKAKRIELREDGQHCGAIWPPTGVADGPVPLRLGVHARLLSCPSVPPGAVPSPVFESVELLDWCRCD